MTNFEFDKQIFEYLIMIDFVDYTLCFG